MDTGTVWTSIASAMLVLAALTVIRLCRVVEMHLAAIAAQNPMDTHEPGSALRHADDSGIAASSPELWSDDVLAEHERETRTTVGADPWYVDTFGLEEDERAYEREQLARAARSAARPRPD